MRKMWGIGLLMVALSAASAEPAPKPIHFRAHARVALDAHGVPQQVDVDQKLPAVIRKAIAQRVGQWRFEPARAGEQPRAGATTVFVDACAVPSVDGDMRLAVDYGWNGPGYADGRYLLPAPRYPVEAARRNKGGAFRVVLQIGTDGRATVETIEAQAKPTPTIDSTSQFSLGMNGNDASPIPPSTTLIRWLLRRPRRLAMYGIAMAASAAKPL